MLRLDIKCTKSLIETRMKTIGSTKVFIRNRVQNYAFPFSKVDVEQDKCNAFPFSSLINNDIATATLPCLLRYFKLVNGLFLTNLTSLKEFNKKTTISYNNLDSRVVG